MHGEQDCLNATVADEQVPRFNFSVLSFTPSLPPSADAQAKTKPHNTQAQLPIESP